MHYFSMNVNEILIEKTSFMILSKYKMDNLRAADFLERESWISTTVKGKTTGPNYLKDISHQNFLISKNIFG